MSEASYQSKRRAHWEAVAQRRASRAFGGYYHRRLADVYRFLIPSGQRVLELGCGEGDLLAAVEPAHGVGLDFAPTMVANARERHPELTFFEADVHDLSVVEGPFDVIILSDLINDLWDVQTVLEEVERIAQPHTRIILNFYSKLWTLPLEGARGLGLATPTLPQNWLAADDTKNLLALVGLEVFRHWEEIVWPVRTPLVDAFANKFLVRFWPFKLFALSNFIVARPAAQPRAEAPKVSVIVPARNEAGNIAGAFERTPQMGSGTELVFVEGHSKDDTYEAIKRAIAANPEWEAQLHQQTGVGKGDAVRLGFEKATGDVLMILDSDLTVAPEDLPRFYEALVSGRGEFINGVRLVYPMEDEAMRFFNLIGNKFFSLAFSWLLGQPIKDTLCGTKVLWKKDYDLIVANRSYFGDFDPFGDFDLLLGAAKLNRRITDLPIRYRQRTYGSTNIQRWRHGVLLLRMVIFAAGRLKFV